MSRVDFIVHSTLYDYGLEFSYAWANDYWLTYNALFVVFAVMAAVSYWLSSAKTRRDLKLSAALFGAIVFLALGGLQDIFFFLLWEGALPSVGTVWWWAPWANMVGTWNSQMQICLTATTVLISLTTIAIATKQKTNHPTQ